MKKENIELVFIVLFVLLWIWSAINPLNFTLWLLENLLIVPGFLLLLYLKKKFNLSTLSFVFVILYLIPPVIGSHYSYSKTPLGFMIGNLLGSERNMYDRLVHFSFGLFLTYPILEIIRRKTSLKHLSRYFFVFMIISGFSGVYEVGEWLTVYNVQHQIGTDFIGMQGDIWDTQKDMFLACLGSIFVLFSLFLIEHSKFSKILKRAGE